MNTLAIDDSIKEYSRLFLASKFVAPFGKDKIGGKSNEKKIQKVVYLWYVYFYFVFKQSLHMRQIAYTKPRLEQTKFILQ